MKLSNGPFWLHYRYYMHRFLVFKLIANLAVASTLMSADLGPEETALGNVGTEPSGIIGIGATTSVGLLNNNAYRIGFANNTNSRYQLEALELFLRRGFLGTSNPSALVQILQGDTVMFSFDPAAVSNTGVSNFSLLPNEQVLFLPNTSYSILITRSAGNRPLFLSAPVGNAQPSGLFDLDGYFYRPTFNGVFGDEIGAFAGRNYAFQLIVRELLENFGAVGLQDGPVLVVVNQAAIRSLLLSSFPSALAMRENLQTLSRTPIRDLNARLFRTRSAFPVVSGIDSLGGVDEVGPQTAKETFNDTPGTSGIRSGRSQFFAAGDFAFVDTDSRKQQVGSRIDTQAGTLGWEYILSEQLALGTAISTIRGDQRVGDLARIRSEGFAFSGYATYENRPLILDLLYSASFVEQNLNRRTPFGSARARPQSSTHSVDLNIHYPIQPIPHRRFATGPWASLQYSHGSIDGYTESGASLANTRVSRQAYDSLVSRLGWQASAQTAGQGWSVIKQARISWDRENLDRGRIISGELVAPPIFSTQNGQLVSSSDFSAIATSAPPGEYYVSLGFGVLWQNDQGWTAQADWECELFRQNRDAHFLSVRVGYEW